MSKPSLKSRLRFGLGSVLFVIPVGLLAGTASAFFLWALDQVTRTRWDHPWLLFLLPLAGVASGWLFARYGRSVEAGNDLIIDEIHQPGGGVPLRMTPIVLLGTLLTHLCGGSVGREGTAVQMGGSLAHAYGRWLGIAAERRHILLMAGVAAGFAAVFGTPFAAALFAMEVLIVGRIDRRATLPVFAAALVGHFTCLAWGAQHTAYSIALGATSLSRPDFLLLAKVALAAVVFGLVARGFATLTHALKDGFRRLVASPLLRPVLGGLLVIGLTLALGTRDFLGLGVSSPDPQAVTILSAFRTGGAEPWSWALKLLFTAITIGSGFKGGEVTPLFFIGATLGNTLAWIFNAPVDLFAGLGFLAVFAGATHTPIACAVMGLELFGSNHAIAFAIACFIAHLAAGKSGIYRAQRRPRA
jgi:H+/Cl- antiporter ClcA